MVNLATLALPPFLTTFCNIKDHIQMKLSMFDEIHIMGQKSNQKTTIERERREEERLNSDESNKKEQNDGFWSILRQIQKRKVVQRIVCGRNG